MERDGFLLLWKLMELMKYVSYNIEIKYYLI